MNDDSTSNSNQSKLPSDEQVDSVLRDFFRLEVPLELSQPSRWYPLTASTIAAPVKSTGNHDERLQSQSVRSVAVAVSVAAMILGILVVISGHKSSTMNRDTAAHGTTDAAGTTPGIDKPMLVSPQGDSPASGRPIAPDGVTLEETDSIKLHQ